MPQKNKEEKKHWFGFLFFTSASEAKLYICTSSTPKKMEKKIQKPVHFFNPCVSRFYWHTAFSYKVPPNNANKRANSVRWASRCRVRHHARDDTAHFESRWKLFTKSVFLFLFLFLMPPAALAVPSSRRGEAGPLHQGRRVAASTRVVQRSDVAQLRRVL